MKFTCEKVRLVSAISVASRTVAQKSAIPALEGILLKAGEFKVMLTGYNLETGITVGLAAAIILLILRRNRTTLHRKNTEILYRDELFQKLSLNVDDVFLMLDAETSKVDLSGSAPPRSARSRAPALAWPSPKTSWI